MQLATPLKDEIKKRCENFCLENCPRTIQGMSPKIYRNPATKRRPMSAEARPKLSKRRTRSTRPSRQVVSPSRQTAVNGFDLQELVAGQGDMPSIFITGYGDVSTTVRAMKAGAVDFFTKPPVDDVLLSSIRSALERSCTALGEAAQMCALRGSYASLSRRERELMGLLVAGRCWLNKQVGAELGISEITVKAHRGKVMRKMKARSLAELFRMAARLGLTDTVKESRLTQ